MTVLLFVDFFVQLPRPSVATASTNTDQIYFDLIIHDPEKLRTFGQDFAGSVLLAQPSVFAPGVNGPYLFDHELDVVANPGPIKLESPIIEISNSIEYLRWTTLRECEARFLGMSRCSRLLEFRSSREGDNKYHLITKNQNLDFHDVIYVHHRNSYFGLEYTERSCDQSPVLCFGSIESKYADCTIVEISANTGKVIWSWSASEHVRPHEVRFSEWRDRFGGPELPTIFDPSNIWNDPFHCNSIDYSPVYGEIMISMRHTDSIYSVSRQSGRINWSIGSASGNNKRLPNCDSSALRRKTSFLGGQHDARFLKSSGDSTISVFDNEGSRDKVARGLFLEINRKKLCYKIIQIFQDPLGSRSYCTGSLRQIGLRYVVVGWGCSTSAFTIFTRSGKPIASLRIDLSRSASILVSPIEEIRSQLSYRIIPVEGRQAARRLIRALSQ